MSKINELKKQNPQFNIDNIEIIHNLFGNKGKYTELSINLIKDKIVSETNFTENVRTELINDYEIDEEFLKDKSNYEIRSIFKLITEFYGYSNFIIINKFIRLNERNLIEQNDITKFKNFTELELQISLAELKLLDKDLEKQTIKLYETNEWLVIKPMSFLASKKYGANTKWCTTQEHNPEYYLRYSRQGILIYCINKVTGEKVAAFKSIDQMYEKETSFWDSIDNRIDSMESNLPNEVMNIIKHEFKNTNKSNWDLLSDDERNRQLLWIENNNQKTRINRQEEDEIVRTYTEESVGPLRAPFTLTMPRETTIEPEEIVD
jgi:hypothetical protein